MEYAIPNPPIRPSGLKTFVILFTFVMLCYPYCNSNRKQPKTRVMQPQEQNDETIICCFHHSEHLHNCSQLCDEWNTQTNVQSLREHTVLHYLFITLILLLLHFGLKTSVGSW